MRNKFISTIYALVFLGSGLWAQDPTKEHEIGKPFKSHMPIEAALVAARSAVSKAKFNVKLFEIHDVRYYSELPVDWKLVTELGTVVKDKGSLQLLEMRKTFGPGPVWVVNYWRSERVSTSGNWWDDANFGLSVIVYSPKKVAIVDGRSVEGKDDRIP